MATLNGNNVYLEWDGLDISGFWTDTVDKNETSESIDTIAGAGATHIMRKGGLKDNTLTYKIISVVTDRTDATDSQAISVFDSDGG